MGIKGYLGIANFIKYDNVVMQKKSLVFSTEIQIIYNEKRS